MAIKNARKSAKQLRKAKKLAPTKPLSVNAYPVDPCGPKGA